MGRIRMGVSVLTVGALAVAGCGSSSSKPLSRAELTAKANAICKTVAQELKTKTVSNQRDIARIAPELASFEETELRELSKLIPPAELESDWKQFVAGAEMLAEDTLKVGEYAKSNELGKAKGLIASTQATQKQMLVIVKRDGLKECEQVT
jgi:hypothetical protein